MTGIHTVLIIACFLLKTICLSSAQSDRLARYPTVLYKETVKFSDLVGDQMMETCHGLNYRALVSNVGSSELYIGGQEILQVVDTETSNVRTLNFSGTPACIPPQCHVSIIQPLTDSCLFVCVTGNTPKCYMVDTTAPTLTKITSDYNVDVGNGAPRHYSQNYTWLYLKDEAKLFTGIGTRTALPQYTFRFSTLIGCTAIGNTGDPITADGSEAWLNNAEFVGEPFLYNDHVYFTYREYSSEEINAAGRIIYSRIARVCQNDTGGPRFTGLAGDFTTFQKARLDCSLRQNDEVQFEYNEIQGTYKSGNTIFAVFTTPRSGRASSAVCAYNVDEIEELFDLGNQNGQSADGLLWTELKDGDTKPPSFDTLFKCSEVPYNTLGPLDETFLQTYPLKDIQVPNKLDYKDESTNSYERDSDAPLFVLDDVRFSQIVVDEDVNNVDVMFLGTERGTVIKAYINDSGAFLVEEIDFNMEEGEEAPIVRMVKGNNSLPIVSNGQCVYMYKQPVKSCSNRTACQCQEDPYCVCDDSNNCAARTGVTGTPPPCNCMDPPKPCTITVVRRKSCANSTDWVYKGKPANLNFAAYAPEGAGLTASKVVCTCESEPETCSQSACNGTEYVTVNTVISNVTTSCQCSIRFTTSCDEKVLTLEISVDNGELIPDCVPETAEYDKQLSSYFFNLDDWKNKQISKSQCLESSGDASYCNGNC